MAKFKANFQNSNRIIKAYKLNHNLILYSNFLNLF